MIISPRQLPSEEGYSTPVRLVKKTLTRNKVADPPFPPVHKPDAAFPPVHKPDAAAADSDCIVTPKISEFSSCLPDRCLRHLLTGAVPVGSMGLRVLPSSSRSALRNSIASFQLHTDPVNICFVPSLLNNDRGHPFLCRSTEALKILASVHGATAPLLLSALDKVSRDDNHLYARS